MVAVVDHRFDRSSFFVDPVHLQTLEGVTLWPSVETMGRGGICGRSSGSGSGSGSSSSGGRGVGGSDGLMDNEIPPHSSAVILVRHGQRVDS